MYTHGRIICKNTSYGGVKVKKTAVMIFTCETCEKTFTQKRYLTQHKRTHRIEMGKQRLFLNKKSPECCHVLLPQLLLLAFFDLPLDEAEHSEDERVVHQFSLSIGGFSLLQLKKTQLLVVHAFPHFSNCQQKTLLKARF